MLMLQRIRRGVKVSAHGDLNSFDVLAACVPEGILLGLRTLPLEI